MLALFKVDDLQEMANKYADTVEETRKLYNEVQDLKGNIRVFCRIRPLGTTGDSNPSCLDAGVDGEVQPCPANILPPYYSFPCLSQDTFLSCSFTLFESVSLMLRNGQAPHP